MAATAVQQALKQGQETSTASQEQEAQRSVKIGRPLGITLLCVMLVLALPIGNFRALQRATPGAFLRQGDVQQIITDRLAAAQNALAVGERAQLEDALYDAVEGAVSALKGAKTAGEISAANQDLTSAVSEMTAVASEVLSEQDRRLLARAADDFAEQGNFLRQEGRKYNEKAQKAKALYEQLPTKFLLKEPDGFSGVW